MIVIICGYPASGKSTYTENLVKDGYTRLNRDTLGGKIETLVTRMETLIKSGKTNFVLDNLYPTRATRKSVIECGKKHNIPVICMLMDTSIEDSMFNACSRMYKKTNSIVCPDKSKDPNIFPILVIYKYRKEFEEPSVAEGFDKVEKIKFARNLLPEYKNKALILDYDGSLRETKSGDKFPKNIDDIRILPKRKEVLDKYVKEGYKLLGASNQSGVAKGDLSYEMAINCFEETNRLLGHNIEIGFCPHKVPPISCYCRKPGCGLGVQWIEKYLLKPSECIMIGDMTTDATFARRCGFKFVDANKFFN